MREPAIREALEVESVFMKDDRERRAYEQREKALKDYESVIDLTKIEAREEGRQEGRAEKAIETAKSLIADGFDMDKISKYTGLSRAEIEKILQ